VPGPGAYRAVSDFGWVEHMKYSRDTEHMLNSTITQTNTQMGSPRITPLPTRGNHEIKTHVRNSQSVIARPKVSRKISSQNSPRDLPGSTKATTILHSRTGGARTFYIESQEDYSSPISPQRIM